MDETRINHAWQRERLTESAGGMFKYYMKMALDEAGVKTDSDTNVELNEVFDNVADVIDKMQDSIDALTKRLDDIEARHESEDERDWEKERTRIFLPPPEKQAGR